MAVKKGKKAEPQSDGGFLDDVSGEGYEGVRSSTPRIKILHFTSPVVLEGDEHVEGAKPGTFYNTVTKKVYGKSMEFIPVKSMSVWLEWMPQDQGGGFKGTHPVGSIPITGDLYKKAYTLEGNEIKEALYIYGLVPGELDQGLVLLSLSGASIKHGINLCTKIGTVKLPSGKIQPFYGSVWELTLNLNTNAKGKYFTFGIGNKTTAEWVRFIKREEYEGHVKPAVEFVKNLVTMLNASPQSQAALPAPEGEETEY